MYPLWLLLLFAILLSACGLVIGGAVGAFVIGLTLGITGTLAYFHKEITRGLE